MSTRRNVDVGDRFGSLVIIRQEGGETHCRHQRFLCRCDCGGLHRARRLSLVKGGTRSCGCLRRSNSGAAAKAACTTHGMTGTKEYRAWAHMIDRCAHAERQDAHRYHGRGIKVSHDWCGPGGFDIFFAHIGPAPGDGYTVDRIENSQGYEPGNVRWATSSQQARNRRSNHIITAFGRTQSLAAWSEETGLKWCTIFRRLVVAKWSPERALTTPLQAGGRPRRT